MSIPMSIIIQDNHTQFVIQAYREWVTGKKRTQIAERIRGIAQQQGQFVRLYKKRTGEYEAIFSTDPGYLLGESIKQYFQHAKNLIFCEKAEGDNLLLVVIKDGNVFLDTLLPLTDLKKELLPFTVLKTSFQMVISGNLESILPPGKTIHDFFSASLASSYEYIQEPLVGRLPTLPIVKLLPLPLALKAEHLNSDSLLTMSILIITALIIFIGLFTYSSHVEETRTPKTHELQKIAPYADYMAALNHTPAPNKVLNGMTEMITTLLQIPGWRANTITQNNGDYTITLQSDGGTLANMQEWANTHFFQAALTSDGVRLHKHLVVPHRATVTQIFSLQILCENLIDAIQQKMLMSRIQLKETIQHHDAQESLLVLHFHQISPQQLGLLATLFNELPIIIQHIQINTNNDALMEGIIELSVWGK